MNQNASAPNGQSPEDRFDGSFVILDPDQTRPSVDLVLRHVLSLG